METRVPYETIKAMLKEFDYDKNSKDDVISFLVYILNLLINE